MENGDWQMHKSLVECNRVMLEKQVLILLGHILLPPATKLGEGYVFTGVCDSVHRGEGGLPRCLLGYPPPRADTPRKQTPPPPGADTPRIRHPPIAEHAGRYGQRAGGTHPTGMQSCCKRKICPRRCITSVPYTIR